MQRTDGQQPAVHGLDLPVVAGEAEAHQHDRDGHAVDVDHGVLEHHHAGSDRRPVEDVDVVVQVVAVDVVPDGRLVPLTQLVGLGQLVGRGDVVVRGTVSDGGGVQGSSRPLLCRPVRPT